MIETIIGDIIVACLAPIAHWLGRRKAAKADAAAQANREGALKDSQTMRDTTETKLDASHAQTDADLERLHADAGLREQSTDVQGAIDAANRGVR